MNNRFLFIAVNFCSFLFFLSSVLSASEWSTRITTEEGTYEFGGPLLEKEKPLVGKWAGQNKNGDAWEILRRPNHVYTIMISWMEEGNKETFRGHGLWSVRKDEFIYVDLLDRDGETYFEWPVEMKYRISNDDIMVLVEDIKSTSDQKVVTYSEDVGESKETRVENFKQLWMKQFDQAEPLEEARLFDQIQLARIVDIQGIVDFFTDPAYAVDRKMAGKWESTDNDPDAEADWKTEVIRRADGTDSYVYLEEGDDSDPVMTHGMWGIRNGKYYGVELISEGEVFPFEETFLFTEKIVKSTPKEFATQWVDTERKILKFFPMVITVTDQRIKEFESDILNKEFNENAFGLPFFKKRIK